MDGENEDAGCKGDPIDRAKRCPRGRREGYRIEMLNECGCVVSERLIEPDVWQLSSCRMIEMNELNQQSITGYNLFFALPRRLISHKLESNLDMQRTIAKTRDLSAGNAATP